MQRHRWLEVVLYPATMAGAVTAAWWSLRSGVVSEGLAVSLPVLAAGLLLFVLERVRPKFASWRPSAATLRVDLLHSIVSTAGVPMLLKAFGLGALTAVAARLADRGFAAWPSHWPLAVQVALGLLLGELGAYWVHRVCHRWEGAWRIHALHHGTEGLNVVMAGRNHPFNVLLVYGLRVAPMLVLGAPAAALTMVSVVNGIHGMLQHANVDMRLGPLNYVVAGPELHHWHHSADMAESNTNFGNILIVWDLVFGTYYNPADRRAGEQVGVRELVLPNRFLPQLALPFIYRRFETRDGVSVTSENSAAHATPETL